MIGFGDLTQYKRPNEIYQQQYEGIVKSMRVNSPEEAAATGRLDALTLFAQSGRFPDYLGYNRAATFGLLDVLKWPLQHDPDFYVDYETANWAAETGQLDVLKWLAQLNPPVLPNDKGVEAAAAKGYLDVLQWLSRLDPPILPDRDAILLAVANDRYDILEWMRIPFQLYPEDANSFAAMGNIDALRWLVGQNPPILPNIQGARYAHRNGHLNVIRWLAERGISR